MLDELYQLSESPTLAQIQAAMAARGITASLMAASSVKKKNFSEYLAEVKRARELGALLTEGDGVDRTDAAAVMLAEQITDQILRARLEGRELEAEEMEKMVLNVSRLRAGDQAAKKLKADLALRDEQIAKLARAKTEWEEERAKIRAAVATAAKKGGLTADSRKLIEDVMTGAAV